ncbi:MAG TPA: hypothetical protein DEA96_18075 [Leptospiraceae bacterium]|nr:hypothetical protein [Spirochaetaceae bacterium]HBS06883.1 hypothetical protein [Leptospiraceae bacterium]
MGLFPAKSLELRNGHSDALLVLPGIGYGPSGRRAMKRFFRKAELDLFVPDYIQRSGIDASVQFLQEYSTQHQLALYSRLYIFCFIAGGYVLHRWMQSEGPEISGVILDRSPYQERAPAIVTRRIPWIARMLLGDFVFELGDARYPQMCDALESIGLKPALIIEKNRTNIIKLFAADCRKMGPIQWKPESFESSFADHCYVPYDHDSIYANFDSLAPYIQSFIGSGSFGDVDRNAPEPG